MNIQKEDDFNHQRLLARHQTVIEALSEGLLYESRQRKILLANPSFCRMFNIPSPEMLIGMDCRDAAQAAKQLFPDPESFMEGIEKRLSENRYVAQEELELKDGRVFERDYVPVHVDGEEHGHYWIYRDITARKIQERKLHEQNQLQRLLIFLASEFINLPCDQIDPMFNQALARIGEFTQVDRVYIFRLDFFARIMHNTHEWCAEGISSHLQELQNVPISHYTEPEQLEALRNGHPFILENIEDLREGTPLRLLLQGQGIKAMLNVPMLSQEECIGFVGFDSVQQQRSWNEQEISVLEILANLLTHVEMRRQSELESNRIHEQMQQVQRLESLGVLAGGIAHDFNNILMAILGNAELAKEDAAISPEITSRLDSIINASNNAADLCRQMLAYAGKGSVSKQELDISKLIQHMRDFLNTLISKKVSLTVDTPASLPLISGDPSQLRQVIMNLVINASEAAGEEKGKISLVISTGYFSSEYLQKMELHFQLSAGEYVQIEVSDNGCGIDTESRKRIFEPFYSTKFTGRGLGLAAVAGIVREHLGAIHVYSEHGYGTTFKILLPACSPHPKTPAKTDKIPAKNDNTPAKNVKKTECQEKAEPFILLAEDDDAVRKLAKKMLEQFGCRVLTVDNGREAVECFRQPNKKEFNLLILDLTMPEMNGSEALKEIRKINPRTRAVISSGFNEKHILDNFDFEEDIEILPKPYSLENMKRVLQKFGLTSPS